MHKVCLAVWLTVQARLETAGLQASVDCLRQEAARTKQEQTDLQAQSAAKQQLWHEQELRLRAEHTQQVSCFHRTPLHWQLNR